MALGCLFGFLAALYAATAGGHTSSNDEDAMYYVTQGLVERGTPALPPVEAELLARCPCPNGIARGPDGSFYAAYGVLPSLLAIPPFLLGDRIATFFEPRYRDFLTRAAVTSLSTVATAGAGVAFACLARELGASPRGATLLGLLYGTTTIAWPYAKYFWSEPLAALLLTATILCAVRAAHAVDVRGWSVTGLVLGLGVATRPGLLVCLPVLGLYLASAALQVAGSRQRWCVLARAGAALGAGLAGPALLIGLYDVVRFGSLLELGYGSLANLLASPRREDDGNVLLGLYGATLSSGKGVFLYSPLLIASVAALPALWRRAPRECLLLAGTVAAQLVLFGSLGTWYGESAWGSRYLVPLTPCLLAPLAAWSGDVQRATRRRYALVAATSGLGLVVQLFAVATNYDTYILATGGPVGPGAEERWYRPAASPLLAAPRLLAERISQYQRRLQAGEFALGQGFYASESPTGPLPRWTDGYASVQLNAGSTDPVRLRIRATRPRTEATAEVQPLSISLDHQPVPASALLLLQPEPGHYQLEVNLPPLAGADHEIELTSPTFVPAADGASSDGRQLGLYVEALEATRAGEPLTLAQLPVVPPLPISAAQLWNRSAFGWFYDPSVPHLIDVWPWYIARSGLPAYLAFTVALPLGLTFLLGGRLARALTSRRIGDQISDEQETTPYAR